MRDTPDPFQRFLDAQAPLYRQVVEELRNGRKQSHWMWFVFPQIAGLGQSPMSRRYAIASRAEAADYAMHATLGSRLRECTGLVVAVSGKTAAGIFGYPDDLKFQSCMTLFEAAVPNEPLFPQALDKYYSGRRDENTLRRLAGDP